MVRIEWLFKDLGKWNGINHVAKSGRRTKCKNVHANDRGRGSRCGLEKCDRRTSSFKYTFIYPAIYWWEPGHTHKLENFKNRRSNGEANALRSCRYSLGCTGRTDHD